MLFSELRKKHPRFIYESFQINEQNNELRICFRFLLEPNIVFTPEVILPPNCPLRQEELENFAFHLGLIETISYWKAACSPRILVKAGPLTHQQIAWWHDLFTHGLGEFFYRNNIDFTVPDFLEITSDSDKKFSVHEQKTSNVSGNLVLVGGGKDSVVTLELLKSKSEHTGSLILNPTKASLNSIRIANYPEPLVVKRSIDPKLLELNKLGYLNGHTPFSAYLAFLGVFVAVLHDYKNVIVSNERSAEEGNIISRNLKVNHQYSKTYRFEKLFREYCGKYLTPKIQYFSLLRPLYEIQISQLFANYPNHYLSFRSCNAGSKENLWCGACAKCAFVYVSLFPFLPFGKMLAIFGEDYYLKPEIAPLLFQLVGLEKYKPFACVGTTEESILAIGLAIQKYQATGKKMPPLLSLLKEKLGLNNAKIAHLKKTILGGWGDENFLPPEYARLVQKTLAKLATK